MLHSSDKIHEKSPIRTYVRREGRITVAQKKALQALWPKYGLNHEPNTETSRFISISKPLTVEIGFGDGQNLINLAQSNPCNVYIGIDVYRPGVGKLLIELEKQGVTNVKIILNDAIEALPALFQTNSLAAVMVYFPDPWPKKRHKKRRLLRQEFLEIIASRLIPGGDLYISTDCENYADDILRFIENVELLDNVYGSCCYAPRSLRFLPTKYEARGLRSGNKIRDIHASRS